MNGPSEIDRFREAFRSKQTLPARQHATLDPVERLNDGAEREKALGAFSEQKWEIDRFREAFRSRHARASPLAPRRPCVSPRGPSAVTRRDAPGGHAAPLRSSEAPFSISHLESVASGAATLPPSRAPSRIACPSTEGDCQPSHRAADSPVGELPGRGTRVVAVREEGLVVCLDTQHGHCVRTGSCNETDDLQDEAVAILLVGKAAPARRVHIPKAFQVTGLTVSPSDDSVVARALQRRSTLPAVFERPQGVASAREAKQFSPRVMSHTLSLPSIAFARS